MRLVDFKDVDTLIRARENCLTALKEAEASIKKEKGSVDCGGVSGVLETGYACNLSEFSDGSGSLVRMNGCYVGIEMMEAARIVLINKIDEIERALTDLDVTVNE